MSAGIWYVVRTKPRQESVAEANLLRQGYAAYLPRLKVLRRIRRQQVFRLEPMFPQYLFFRPGREAQSIAPVRSTLGVLGVVRFGTEPAVLDAEKLDAIHELESRQNLYSIEELSAIVPGSRVTVVEGPLAGLEGLVSSVSAKRVEVLMQLLGNDTRVRLVPSALELAA
ncbi:MAG: transcriptional activator RfaH [Rhodocyclales bacterium]|nr:transcriptional activator RfaH [Rhodocyclales bacterium]